MQLRRSPRLASKANNANSPSAKANNANSPCAKATLPTAKASLPTAKATKQAPIENIQLIIEHSENNIIIVTEDNANKYNLRAGDTINIHNNQTDSSTITGDVTVTGTDGFIYKGQMLNGWFHGTGVSKYNSGAVYQGEYVNGCYHGKGKIKYSDGIIYEGEFANGVRHGKGKLVYTNGQSYEGEFSNNVRHGKGINTYPMDELEETRCPTYIGDYMNNVEHGEGVYDWGTHRECYTGEWKNGDPHGKGKLLKDNNKDQIGTFKNGSYVGK
jgi:hypothetical protein